MSQRQRFLETLLGEGSDRFPFFELEPDAETLERWHREGFPRGATFSDSFHLEPHHSVGLMLRSYPFFQKAPDLLHDASAFARHYAPDQAERYEQGFVERSRRLHQEGRVLYVDASGGGILQMLGVGDWESLKAACFALVERPRVLERLVEKTTDFYCLCLERVLSQVPVDYASMYEPIASNIGPVISPKMFERFAIPGYRKVNALLKQHHVPLRILCTTGGDLTSILPPLLDAGINGLWISNIKSANMEYGTIRQRFGSELALIGGIDATALTMNEATVRLAIAETVPNLLREGHYLPCLDDRPRSTIPFAHYRLYRQLLEDIARSG